MIALAQFISLLIQCYIFVIIAHIAVSWLVVFKVIDTANPQARNLLALLQKAVDPVMKPVQKYVPPIAGIDITPIIIILGLQLLNNFVWRLLV